MVGEEPDLQFYYESDVLHVISKPEPLNSRHSKLREEDWKHFKAHTQSEISDSFSERKRTSLHTHNSNLLSFFLISTLSLFLSHTNTQSIVGIVIAILTKIK